MKETATKKKRMTALERRQQIMQHAFSLIRERGFKTVSMRDIAREADINEALIYRHFLTKEALLWAIVREMIETQPVRSLFPADGKDEFKAQLQVFVDFYLEKTLGDPSILRIILYAVMENYPLPNEFNFQKEGTFLNWMYQSIEKGKADWGFDRQADTLVYLSSFMGGLIYFALQAAVIQAFPKEKSTNFKHTYVNMFLKSLET
jgi:AcrR family transcriptional regulator